MFKIIDVIFSSLIFFIILIMFDKYQITGAFFRFGQEYSLILFLSAVIVIYTFYKLKILNNSLKKFRYCIQSAWLQGIYLGLLVYLFVLNKISITQSVFFILLYIIFLLLIYYDKYGLKKKDIPISDIHSSLYFKVLRSPEPLLSIENDSYDRKAIVEKISNLIFSKNLDSSFIIGINGQWGIGKSTLLNFISQKINKRGIEIALSAWDYRTGKRFVEALLKKIGKEIDDFTGNVSFFSDLFSKLLIQISEEESVFRAKFGVNFSLKFSNNDPKRIIQNKLSALQNFHIIIYVDDLDRVEREDLMSILKSINMISDLPQLTYILAYDKKYLYELLFSNNPNKSIDYL